MSRAALVIMVGIALSAVLFAAVFSPRASQRWGARSGYHVSVAIGKADPSYTLPEIQSPSDVVDAATLPLVVIDAGHGGHDPGSISPETGTYEKTITLAIARQIGADLLASKRVRVALTRSDDRFLVLEDRFGMARKLGAHLFLSIHADSTENRDASGASIYTLSDVASDREAARLAARENRANIIGGIDMGGQTKVVGDILIDLSRRETMDDSSGFARLLRREAGATGVKFRSTGQQFAGFVVLKAPDVPSILFETGYISNKADEEILVSGAGREAIAQGVRRAVMIYFSRRAAL